MIKYLIHMLAIMEEKEVNLVDSFIKKVHLTIIGKNSMLVF